MYARVLGPLTLALNNRNATPTARKQRQLLALLLIRHSTVVPVATLVEELWNDNPPRSATTVVQTYILGIRKNWPKICVSIRVRLRRSFCAPGARDICSMLRIACSTCVITGR
ncbi:AfsR/SARP family transcriptional regulator [Nocardia mexicana]|uniref:AfsR/SARP family transcriptional regulator n=1 Tax=Nocardia mexicana TaxID=279262 RepID=UPI003CCC487D